MTRLSPWSTLTDTPVPHNTLFRSRCALAAEQAVRLQRQILHPLRDLGVDIGGADMFGEALGIFGVIVVEARTDAQFGDGGRLIGEHRDGQFATLDERLDRKSTRLNSSH